MILFKHFFSHKELNVSAVISQYHPLPIRTNSRRPLGLACPRNTYLNFRMASNIPRNALFGALVNHDKQRVAIAHSASNQKYTYGQLVRDVALGRDWLDEKLEHMQKESECIAFLVENGYDYVGARNLHSTICYINCSLLITMNS